MVFFAHAVFDFSSADSSDSDSDDFEADSDDDSGDDDDDDEDEAEDDSDADEDEDDTVDDVTPVAAAKSAKSASSSAAAAAAASKPGKAPQSTEALGMGVVRDFSHVPDQRGSATRVARVDFSSLNLSKPLLRAVADLGFATATPIQVCARRGADASADTSLATSRNANCKSFVSTRSAN